MMTEAMMEAGPVVAARGLGKKLGDTQAVNDLSFEVKAGSVFGLLGLNGSGKTTTIRLLLGLLAPDAGRSSVFGEDSLALSRATRRRIGYLSEKPFPLDDLPLPYLLRYVSAFFDRWDWARVEDLVRRLEVPQDRTLHDLSAGERRKAELALTLAPDPDLLVLDDPAVGLDVTVRREFLRAALEVARGEGKTVLFTSHVLTDVERVADTVGFIESGRMKLTADLDELKARTKRLILTLPPGHDGGAVHLPGEIARWREGRDLVLVTGSYAEEEMERLSVRFGPAQVEDLNLEEIFCAVLGKPRPGLAARAPDGEKA
jgi:ABC-2 type transport system ATP-binding protein